MPNIYWFSENGDRTYEAHGTEYELPNKIAYNESCANIRCSYSGQCECLKQQKIHSMVIGQNRFMYNAGISDLTYP